MISLMCHPSVTQTRCCWSEATCHWWGNLPVTGMDQGSH